LSHWTNAGSLTWRASSRTPVCGDSLGYPSRHLTASPGPGSYEAGRKDNTREGFAAIGTAEEFLGLGLAPQINNAEGELELGYIVALSARGRGVATEILRLLTRWAFSDPRVLRSYLIIHLENHASHRVAERCGYRREGVMRSIHLKQGRRIDATLWSRLPADPDPPATA
jgi:RimJ/RimL family protein N-acetyltransferase